VNAAELAAIDHRNGHAVGVSLPRDVAHAGVNGGAVGYRLCNSRDGKAERGKKPQMCN
jgi:hypothetical protein